MIALKALHFKFYTVKAIRSKFFASNSQFSESNTLPLYYFGTSWSPKSSVPHQYFVPNCLSKSY